MGINISPMQLKTLQEIKAWYRKGHPRGPYPYEIVNKIGKSEKSVKMYLSALKDRGLVSWKGSGSLAITDLGESVLK